ncbi:MAG: molybdenum cofactor biosynthesis protein MoaE [Deltaproteobacteria bacterium]|nr:molybdenum cofactor biosynthesis protein MoaE [Deltaproteobacteria bacterium]
MIDLTYEKIDVSRVRNTVVHDEAGAILIFEGTTRNSFEGKKVLELRYEAYEEMARKELQSLVHSLESEHPTSRVAIVHRLGIVEVGETSVVIAVSAPHRDEAYTVSRKAIDQLKSSIPIWKKEMYQGGASWKANQ